MSGLETLPPDQRAVLQLILVQGRGYADLATTLRLDAAAVRERALAAAQALGSGAGPDLAAETRGRVVDYLLGQQDDGERIVTFAALSTSPAACRWAQSLREQFSTFALEELPEVPARTLAAVTNGSIAAAAPVTAALAPTAPSDAAPAPTPSASLAAPAAAATPVATPPAASASPPAPPRTPASGSSGAAPPGPRPSRLGGAILIAGAAALAIVLAIVLIGGGDGGGSHASTSTAQTSAQTQTTPRTQATTPAASAGSGQNAPTIVAQVNLRPTQSGSSAIGLGLVQRARNGRQAIAIEATRLPANGAQDIYAVWLQGTASSKFLGFVPRQVRAGGSFTVTAPLPANASSYDTVLITREGTTAVPTAPGSAILSGALRLTS